MRLIFTFILMLCSGMVDAQNIIKKCKTCGKPISQCQYKGTHVASSSVSPSPQKKRNHVKKRHKLLRLIKCHRFQIKKFPRRVK